MGFNFRTLIHTHHGKGMEIRLLQATLLDCELLIARGRGTEDCAALQLGCDDPWVHIMAAIYDAHYPMHPDLAVRDGDFSHLCVIAPKCKVHCNTPPTAFRQGLTPTCFLSGKIKYREMPRMLHQQSTPELVRILAPEGGEFVNETLSSEASVRVSHRPPPLNRHADLGLVRFDRQVRNLIRKIVNALDRCGIVCLSLHHHGLEHCPRHDRLTYQPRSPTDWVAARIYTTDNGMEESRGIPAALHIVFAGPDGLYWNSRSLGHINGFDHEVGLRRGSTAESTAQICGVDLDFLIRKAGGLGRGGTVHCLELCSSPNLARVCPQIHGTVERLHHEMGEVRYLVNSFDFLSSLRERSIWIAIAAYTRSR